MQDDNETVLKPGTRIDQYVITGILGRGGFGITYRVKDEMLDKEFALKEFFPEELVRRENGGIKFSGRANAEADYRWGLKKFFDEARLLAQFNHPNIIAVRRVFEANDTAYMVLDLVEGMTFEKWLRGLDSRPTQDELDLVAGPLLSALALVHGNRTWHLDISPENIMIRAADGAPILLDFGASRFEIKQHSQLVSALVFKSGYSAPEQYISNADRYGPWTDIYAFGATLYRAVTGARPSEATARQLSDDLVPALQIGFGRYRTPFLEAIDTALRLSPEDRPQSIAEWRAKLLAGTEAAGVAEGGEPARTVVVPAPAARTFPSLPDLYARAIAFAQPYVDQLRALNLPVSPQTLAIVGGSALFVLIAGAFLLFGSSSRCGGFFSGGECWGAVVDSGGNIFARVEESSREAAEAGALKSCSERFGHAECRVITTITEDECWSLAEVPTDPTRWKAASGHSIERAETDARWSCERAFGVCQVVLTFCADGRRGH